MENHSRRHNKPEKIKKKKNQYYGGHKKKINTEINGQNIYSFF